MAEQNTLNARLVLRNDTAAKWTEVNPVLLKGEIGIETDTKKMKVGDGSTAWNDLGYSVDFEDIDAEHVFFKKDLITTTAIGNITLTNGQATIPATGKNLKQVFDTIFVKEQNPKITQPSVNLSVPEAKAYEVGTKVTPSFTASLNAGSYQYGPATGITATSWSVTDNASNPAVEAATGSFPELTVGDSTNYTITATANHTAGAVPVNLEELQTDVFCFSGHKKLMGPYGSGGLCLKAGLELTDEALSLVQAPSAKKLGQLCSALDFIEEKGMYGIAIFPHRLAKRFFEAVKSMKDVTVYGDFGTNTRIPTVALSVSGFSSQEVKDFLRKRGITVAAGSLEAPRLMKSFGREQEGVVRFSFGYFNTRQEVNEAVWALMELLGLNDLYLLS